MIQWLGLGVILVHSPEVFILDEPASGLDPKARMSLRRILKSLSAHGKTILISSHILAELSGLCSHLAIMNQGEILQYGEVEQIEKGFSTSTNVRVTLLKDSDLAVELIKERGDIRIVEVENDTIIVEMDKGPEAIADLNTHLVQNGMKVISLYQEKSTLEDIYLKISGGDEL